MPASQTPIDDDQAWAHNPWGSSGTYMRRYNVETNAIEAKLALANAQIAKEYELKNDKLAIENAQIAKEYELKNAQ